MNHSQATLARLSFPDMYPVEGRSSIADLFKPQKRCGIYVLSFSNGEWYCGQAMDVTRRYVQHRQNHPDIVAVRFKEVPRDCLNDEERYCIHTLEAEGFQLRNIALTSIPHGESDFDLIMPVEQQEHWLQQLDFRDLEGPRMKDDALRAKYHRRLERMMQLPGIEGVLRVLNKYVQFGIPAVRRGEASFWVCSCLPPYRARGVTIFSRININWQEVFTASTDEETKKIRFSFHMARSPYKGKSLGIGFRRKILYRGISLNPHQYWPGGQDQINIELPNIDSTLRFLDEPDILSAIRLFNLRLMKKGPSAFSRNHCLDLADRLIEPV